MLNRIEVSSSLRTCRHDPSSKWARRRARTAAGTTLPNAAEGPQGPAVDEGRVYAGSNNTMFAFDANGCGTYRCAPVWTGNTSCSFFGGHSPSVANGVVYSTCGNSYLYAFDASTGDVLWQYYTAGSGYPMRSSPTIVNGRLFHSATFDFTLYAFELPEIQASVTIRNGTNVNVVCFATLTLPIIGTSWDSVVLHGHHPGATYTAIVGYAAPATGPVIPAGELLVDLSSSHLFTDFRQSPGTENLHSIAIPNDIALVGQTAATQALILGGGGELCNALDVVIGN